MNIFTVTKRELEAVNNYIQATKDEHGDMELVIVKSLNRGVDRNQASEYEVIGRYYQEGVGVYLIDAYDFFVNLNLEEGFVDTFDYALVLNVVSKYTSRL